MSTDNSQSLIAYSTTARQFFTRKDKDSPWREIPNALVTGIFDNRKELRREAWLEGGKVGQWTDKVCGLREYIDTMARGWEKKALEHPFRHYPDLPECTENAPDENTPPGKSNVSY